MGCAGSKAAQSEARVSGELAPTGGGSIILAKDALPEQPGGDEDAPTRVDGSLVVTKGGSYVIGRKYAGAWEPGSPIDRPENFSAARHVYIPVGDGKVIKLSYSCFSEQGRSPKPPVKPNQDSFVALEALGNNPQMALFGVFDGHGPKGEDASNYCRVNLPDQVLRSPLFVKQPYEALRQAFEVTHRRFIAPEISRVPGVDTAVSGSTAIVVMVHRDGLMCANVGDSRAMIGTLGARGSVVARPLSVDHKPNRPDERARLMQASGRILSERQLGIEGGDPDKFYVCRVHNGTIRYGVLFTRSIGDADGHAHLGLSATPEVKTGRLDARDRFVVLASDGVWDYMSEEDVAGLVLEADGDAHLATLNVVQTAKAYWDRESLARRDDITAIVIMLRFMSEQEAEADKRATAAAASAAAQSGGAGSAASGPFGAVRAANPSVAGAASTAAVQVQVEDDGLPAAAAAGVGAPVSAAQPTGLLAHSAGSAARHPDSAAAAHSAAASVAGAGAGTDSAVSAPFAGTPSAGLPNGATPSAGAEVAHLLSASSGGPSGGAGLPGSVGPALVVNGPTSTTADLESFPLSGSGELLSPPVPVAAGAVDAEAAGTLLLADPAGDFSGSRRASATAASAGRVISGSLPAGDEAAGAGTGDVALRPQVLRLVSEGVQAQSLSRGITLSSHSNPGITPSMVGTAVLGAGPNSTSAAGAASASAAAPSLLPAMR